MANELLTELNAFRAAEGKEAFKDWRKARHMPMLEDYRNVGQKTDDFEMSPDELAAQVDRPKVEEESDAAASEHATDALAYALSGMHAQVEKLTASTEEPSAEDRLRSATSADFAGNKGVQDAAREIAKAKSYKEVAYYGKSTTDKPVAFIHQFLSDNPGMTRKEAVIALTEGYGINYSTARTQYQRWFTAQKQAK